MTSATAGRALSAIALVVALVALPALYVRAQTQGAAGGSMSRMMSGCGGMMGGGMMVGGGERPNQQWRR